MGTGVRRGGVTVFAAVGLTLAALAGCAGGTTPVNTPRTSPSAAIGTPGLDDLYLAEQLLIRSCMNQQGFEFWALPRKPVPRYRTFPFVVDDIAWARKNGYGSALRTADQRAAGHDPNLRYFTALSAERRAAAAGALNGLRPEGLEARLPGGGIVRHSDQGCTSKAQQELYGDLPAWFRATRMVDNFRGQRAGMVTGNPRYARAVDAWSRCMKAAGHDYAGPAAARAVYETARTSRPSLAETRLATAEARCADRSSLATVATALDRTYDDQLRRRFPTEVADYARLQRAALPRAREVVVRER